MTNTEPKKEKVLLFFNRSSLTTDGVREALTAFLRTPSWIVVRALFGVMACVGVVMLVRGIINDMELTGLLSGAVLMIFSVAFYIHRFLMYPAKTAEAIVKKKREQYKSEQLQTEYRFYEGGVTCVMNGEETAEVTFDDVRRVFRTENYWVLSTFRHKMLLLSPEGFEAGDEADFLRLMKQKCPKALPKKER